MAANGAAPECCYVAVRLQAGSYGVGENGGRKLLWLLAVIDSNTLSVLNPAIAGDFFGKGHLKGV